MYFQETGEFSFSKKETAISRQDCRIHEAYFLSSSRDDFSSSNLRSLSSFFVSGEKPFWNLCVKVLTIYCLLSRKMNRFADNSNLNWNLIPKVPPVRATNVLLDFFGWKLAGWTDVKYKFYEIVVWIVKQYIRVFCVKYYTL